MLVRYWELLLLQGCVVSERMEGLMMELLERREGAKLCLGRLEGFTCTQEQKVMKTIEGMLEGYAESPEKSNEEGASCDYIVLVHKKMIRVGLGLLKQLHYRDEELIDR